MLKCQPVEAVIYDLDGLLLDTEHFYTEASQSIAARYGKSYDWSLKSRMIGKRAPDSARIFTEALGLPLSPEEYLEARAVVLEHLFPQAEPMPGAVRLTEHLYRSGVPQAVATSSDRRHFDLKISRHKDWFRLFRCVVIGDDPEIRRGKPAPDTFLLAAARLGVAPARCLVFEDSPVGVQAALTAGMPVIAVPDPRLPSESLQGASQVLKDLREFNPVSWGLPGFPEKTTS